MPADLSDLHHHWRQTDPGQWNTPWDCPDCLVSSASAYDALCPDRVAAALDRLASERDRLQAILDGSRGPASCGAHVSDAPDGIPCLCPLPPDHAGPHATAIGAP